MPSGGLFSHLGETVLPQSTFQLLWLHGESAVGLRYPQQGGEQGGVGRISQQPARHHPPLATIRRSWGWDGDGHDHGQEDNDMLLAYLDQRIAILSICIL